ncbi:MAG: helix-turn-helix transcriptional regulator [Gammaproteobacteria bacterium]
MKKHPKKIVNVPVKGKVVKVPLAVYKAIELDIKRKTSKKIYEKELLSPEDVFLNLQEKYTKAGAYLKGLRYREGLTQIEFANTIEVTQGDLSKMENGKRNISKKLAQKIGKLYRFNYQRLL